MAPILHVLNAAWQLLLSSAVYILFGLMVSGFMKAFLNPDTVYRHLGRGRFASVFKAALIGIPIPLCSCGVLPAALSLKRHGANNGATTAFMIATPESGVDAIAVTYALMDPIMTIARPVAAMFTAVAAGIAENLLGWQAPAPPPPPDAAAGGKIAPKHGRPGAGIAAGMKFAFIEFWGGLAGWFFLGILLAGAITAWIPEDFLASHLGPGLPSMLLMLVIGIPVYICATASTPVAAALILKGISPGAALVFLLAGPATNMASLTVLFGILGRRAAAVYLAAISIGAVGSGLLLDQVYGALGISAQAAIGQAAEVMPPWVEAGAVMILLLISVKPIARILKAGVMRVRHLRSRPDPSQPDRPENCGAT